VTRGYHPRYAEGWNREDIIPGQPAGEILSQSNQRRAGGVAQVAKCLPSKSEALSSDSRTAKENHKNSLRSIVIFKCIKRSHETKKISNLDFQKLNKMENG
jgi:hypothetical protein